MAQTSNRSSWVSSSAVEVPSNRATTRGGLWGRRLAAWGLEAGLVWGSIALPWYLTQPAPMQTQQPIAPSSLVRAAATEGAARPERAAAATSLRDAGTAGNRWHWLWILPVAMVASQLYTLRASGQTFPKALLRLQVTAAHNASPTLPRIVVRELVGRWGSPLLLAYGLSVAGWGIGIVPTMAVLTLLQGSTALFSRTGRATYDYWAGTQVVMIQTWERQDAAQPVPTYETGGLSALVLVPGTAAPQAGQRWSGLGHWRSLVNRGIGIGLGVGAVVALVGFGSHLNQRRPQPAAAPSDDVFLALVDQLSQGNQTLAARQATTLALASTQDPRAVRLLVDLLSQSQDAAFLRTLQQGLVTLGPPALPPLRQLNQTLANDLKALPPDQRPQTALRQQAVQQTINKLLLVHGGRLADTRLSHTDLSQVIDGPAAFTLVLEQQTLAGLDWRNASLLGARFRKSRFFDPGDDGRLDTGDDLITDFSGSDLTAASLVNAWVRRGQFRSASLLRANLSNIRAELADFTGANLSSAQLIQADLTRATLDAASLVGADLTNAQLSQASLQGSRLQRATAAGGSFAQADLTAASAVDADFSEADFTNAVLAGANLKGSRLQQANLAGADLRQANLTGADLRQVQLQGAELAGADLTATQFAPLATAAPDSFITIPSPTTVQGQLAGVDFSETLNLPPDQLGYICSQGGMHPGCNATSPPRSR